MVDPDTEYLYVRLLDRSYKIIAQQRQQIQQLQEQIQLLSKGKKQAKAYVGKSKLLDSNSR